MSISEAKKEIKRWKSLVSVSKSLGFHLSDEFSDSAYEYVITPNALKKHLPVMIKLLDQSGYHKNYLLWTLEDINDAVCFVAALAMSKRKVLNIDDSDRWNLVSPEKFSSKELVDNTRTYD